MMYLDVALHLFPDLLFTRLSEWKDLSILLILENYEQRMLPSLYSPSRIIFMPMSVNSCFIFLFLPYCEANFKAFVRNHLVY